MNQVFIPSRPVSVLSQGGINQGQASSLFQTMLPYVNGFLTVLAAILFVYTVISFGRVAYQMITNPEDPHIKSVLVDTVRNVVIAWVVLVVAFSASRVIVGFF